MAKRRANGEGNIRKRKDGRWEGRYTAGHTPEGKPIYRNVLGRTKAEVVKKLHKAIDETKGIDVVKAGQYTLGQWMRVWYERWLAVTNRPNKQFLGCLLGDLERHNPHRGTHSTGRYPVLGQKMGQKMGQLPQRKICAGINKEKGKANPRVVNDSAGAIFLLLTRIPECLGQYIVKFYRGHPMCSWKRTLRL